MTVAMVDIALARAAQAEETLGEKIKKIFVKPKPTPTPRKHRKTSATKKKATPTSTRSPSPSPAPSTTPSVSSTPKISPSPSIAASPERIASPSPAPSATLSPQPNAAGSPESTAKAATAPEEAASSPDTSSRTSRRRGSQYLEPVRAISPGPRKKISTTPTPKVSLPAERTPPPTTPTVSPQAKGTLASIATISAADISVYENNPPEVRRVLDLALDLTTQNLGYKYGSADPANGGMDCSGFIYYTLSKSGVRDVPRDAREQYIWIRKAGNFQAVLGHSEDTFELDALQPGDLLFWSGTYSVNRDPAITHTMIYLGREKATNHRIMVGASDGRTYKGKSRFGVSVFDFKVSRLAPRTDEQSAPVFVGYGRIPALRSAD
jgi:cell wall-associated NlpC family hydrolase